MSRLPWIFPGAPLKANGVPGNIQGNLDNYGIVTNLSVFHHRESQLKSKPDFDAEESIAATNLGFFDEGIFEYQDFNRNPTASFSFYMPGYRPNDGVFTAAKDSECISHVPVRDCIDTNRFNSIFVTRM